MEINMRKERINLNKGNVFWINLIFINIMLSIGGSLFVLKLCSNFNSLRFKEYVEYKIIYSQEKENLLYSSNIEKYDYKLGYHMNWVSSNALGTIIKQNIIYSKNVVVYIITPEIGRSFFNFSISGYDRYRYFYQFNLVNDYLFVNKGGLYHFYLQVYRDK